MKIYEILSLFIFILLGFDSIYLSLLLPASLHPLHIIHIIHGDFQGLIVTLGQLSGVQPSPWGGAEGLPGGRSRTLVTATCRTLTAPTRGR